MRLLRTVWGAWQRLALRIAIVNGLIIMALFYILVMTPYALVLRVLRRDLLDRKWDAQAASYWIPRARAVRSRESYFRPF